MATVSNMGATWWCDLSSLSPYREIALKIVGARLVHCKEYNRGWLIVCGWTVAFNTLPPLPPSLALGTFITL